MAKLAIPAAVLAALAVGACAVQPRTDAPAARSAVTGQPILYGQNAPVAGGQPLVPATATFKPGSGILESIALVHILPPAGTEVTPRTASPSAGATTAGERLAYRLTIRMDDGSFQAVDVDNRNFLVGDRIAIVGDGRVSKQ